MRDNRQVSREAGRQRANESEKWGEKGAVKQKRKLIWGMGGQEAKGERRKKNRRKAGKESGRGGIGERRDVE